MSKQDQAVNDVLIEMAMVTANYLDNDEVQVLVNQWQGVEQVSVTMIQQCMLDTIRLYPKLKPYKSSIRKQFWDIVQAKINLSSNTNSQNDSTQSTEPSTFSTLDKQRAAKQFADALGVGEAKASRATSTNNQQLSESKTVSVFYTVISAIKSQLNEADIQAVFKHLHHIMQNERTLKDHRINVMQFVTEQSPPVPDDVKVLNNLVQLVYVSLCEIVGPSDADDILYHSATIAKQQYSKTLVDPLF